jgi:hypothetical protein
MMEGEDLLEAARKKRRAGSPSRKGSSQKGASGSPRGGGYGSPDTPDQPFVPYVSNPSPTGYVYGKAKK